MSSRPTDGQYPEPKGSGYVGRFAPSPTGPLHFGSLLAAVGSYLQARVACGAWLLRIEDLDSPRVVPGAADNIVRTLAAFGFEWHGAIEYQSHRLERYAAAVAQLRANNQIYGCSCSRAQIAASQAHESPLNPEETRYPGTCRLRSLPHTADIALRFRVSPTSVGFVDRLQGAVTQDVTASVGDFVIQRRDGIYAYHLAVVVDDAAQGITEVVRGVDLLSSTPQHILLQAALNVSTPAYVHLPLAVDSLGRKLSKSSQSVPIDVDKASQLLWQSLDALCQSPPLALHNAPLAELWTWAFANWSLAPLIGQTTYRAPAPLQPPSK